MTNRLESSIEREFCNYVKQYKAYAIKLCTKHWPDRVVILPNGRTYFVEFKRGSKGVLSVGQHHVISELDRMNQHVYVARTIVEAKEQFHYEIQTNK